MSSFSHNKAWPVLGFISLFLYDWTLGSPSDLDQGMQLGRKSFRPEFRSLDSQFNDMSTSLCYLLKSHQLQWASFPYVPRKPGIKCKVPGVWTRDSYCIVMSNFISEPPPCQDIWNSSIIINWNHLPNFTSLRNCDAELKKKIKVIIPAQGLYMNNTLTYSLHIHRSYLCLTSQYKPASLNIILKIALFSLVDLDVYTCMQWELDANSL